MCSGDEIAKQDDAGIELPFEPWEFKRTDEHLWLHFNLIADKDDGLERFQMPIYVQLAGVDTKFVPLAYFEGNEAERKKQVEINDKISAFIVKQLKGKTVWIDDSKPAVFAGPGQVLGIVWLDRDRKQSLQQLLVEKGLAEKH